MQYAYSNEFIRRRNPGARLQKISGIESNDSKKIACGLFKGQKGLTTLNYRKRESELACYGEEIKSKFSEEMIPNVAAFSQKKRKKEKAGCFFVMRRILYWLHSFVKHGA